MLKSNYLTNRSTSVSNGAYIYFKENLLTRNVSLRKKTTTTNGCLKPITCSIMTKTTKTHRGEMECVSVMCARVTVCCVYARLCDERARNCVCARERERELEHFIFKGLYLERKRI